MIRYHISLFILLSIACITQQYFSSMETLFNARVLLFHTVFLCCAVTVKFPAMLLLAYFGGFLWDADNTLAAAAGDPSIYHSPTGSLHFGYSIILFGIMGVIMQGIQPLFRKGVWQISAILSGVSLSIYLLIEFLLINFIRGDFTFTHQVAYQIGLTSLISMGLAPVIFILLFKLSNIFDYTIRYDGLKRRYFNQEGYSIETAAHKLLKKPKG
ncbi:hypothetical protein [Rubritalea marina]|uniref:hypothetical protein n=1 Tax=Rubritalea marina TaxID=361055 RepID=UPI00036EED96|nr:hypothetical protein [Rubritalea marina]